MNVFFSTCLLLVCLGCSRPEQADSVAVPTFANAKPTASLAPNPLYDSLGLRQAGLSQQVFDMALAGRKQLANHHPMLTIADMSQPSTRKRLYVINLNERKLLFTTYVAHGRNSGQLTPTMFSNEIGSNKTSLGFYKTMGTYMGRHGLSLQLKGVEKNLNHNVQDRNIVLHGANYVSEDTLRLKGRIGWSEGCPAIPYAVSKSIIKAVKDGSCLFVYAPDSTYLHQSALLNNPNSNSVGIK